MGVVFSRIRAGWKALTPVEKFKNVLKIVCCAGMGAMASDAALRTIKNSEAGPVTKASVMVAAWGLGGYLGEKSGEYLGETTDAIIALHNMSKEAKKAKEEEANG